MNIKTPTNARKEFYELLKHVNVNHEPVIISGSKSENNAVIVSQKDWIVFKKRCFLNQLALWIKWENVKRMIVVIQILKI